MHSPSIRAFYWYIFSHLCLKKMKKKTQNFAQIKIECSRCTHGLLLWKYADFFRYVYNSQYFRSMLLFSCVITVNEMLHDRTNFGCETLIIGKSPKAMIFPSDAICFIKIRKSSIIQFFELFTRGKYVNLTFWNTIK